MTKSKGWNGESQRHSMANRGIKTITKKPTYSKKSINSMTKNELTIEVQKVFNETIFKFEQSMKKSHEKARNYLSNYEEYLKYFNEHGGHGKKEYVIVYGEKIPIMGAYEMFDVKPEWNEEQIKAHLKKVYNEWPKYKDDTKNMIKDLQIFTDKVMNTKHGDYGYISGLVSKPKDSNILLTLVYDGGAYDYFSYEADYGEGILKKAFEKNLKTHFGNSVILEEYNSWSCELIDNR